MGQEQNLAEAVGRRIAAARRARGMTQDDLATLAPFSRRSLQDYEAGVTVPYRHIRELSRLLGRPAEWFINGEDFVDEQAARLERLERGVLEVQELMREVISLVAQRSRNDVPFGTT